MKKVLCVASAFVLAISLSACLPPPLPGMNVAGGALDTQANSAAPEQLAQDDGDAESTRPQNFMMPLVASCAGQWYVWWEEDDRREPIGFLSVGEIFGYFYAEGNEPTGFISDKNEVFRTPQMYASRELCVIRVKLPCPADSAILVDAEDSLVCSAQRPAGSAAQRAAYSKGDYVYLVAPADATDLTLKLTREPLRDTDEEDAGEFICLLQDLPGLAGQSSLEGNYSPSSRSQKEEVRTVEITIAAWPSSHSHQNDKDLGLVP